MHPKKGKEKTIKDIITNMESIHNGRWNWYQDQEKKEPKKSSHYEGWFWDFDTKSFKRWEDLKFNG